RHARAAGRRARGQADRHRRPGRRAGLSRLDDIIRRVQCAQLSLANFRNYVRLELDLAADAVVVVGENAQGKSNLLEAIYCLATTKSFRAGTDRELINWDVADDLAFARMGARAVRQGGPPKLEVSN